MTLAKGANDVLIVQAPQRSHLIRESRDNSARREPRLRKSALYDAKNPLKKNLQGGAGDLVQALNHQELRLGEGTLDKKKDNGERCKEKKLSPGVVKGARVDEQGVLLLLRKADVDAVLPEKREGSVNSGLPQLIGTPWKIHKDFVSTSSPVVPLKKLEE